VLPKTPSVALVVCAALGLFVLAVLYYVFRNSIAAATANPKLSSPA